MKREKLSPAELRLLLGHDPEQGTFVFKPRPRELFETEGAWKKWTTDCEGKPAMVTARNRRGYLAGNIFGNTYAAHRVMWAMETGEWPDLIDHINGDLQDNRFCNLRSVDSAGNAKNQALSHNNKSGHLGVYVRSENGKWRATIRVKRRVVSLGDFAEYQDAVKARQAAEKHYGFHPNHGRRAPLSH